MADLRDIFPCLVKLETVHSQPSYVLPWQAGRSLPSTSSGFIIDARRIVTNAHCVAGAAQVRVRRPGSARRFTAHVIAVGRDCDLAILGVKDEAFWTLPAPGSPTSRHPPPRAFIDVKERGDVLPALEERVTVVGFPLGGDTASVTSGIVSRIEMQPYTNGILRLLAVQVDAAINPGNSGGPVLDSNRRLVGIAFQALSGFEAQNVGYIIPITVLSHFLEDLRRHGKYTGFPSLLVETQGLENPAMRKYLGLDKDESGVMVTRVWDLSCCKGQVQVGDIITEIDGVSVADDFTIEFPSELLASRGGPIQQGQGQGQQQPSQAQEEEEANANPSSGERIDMEFLVTQHHVGDNCTLTLFNKLTGYRRVNVTLSAPEPLVPPEGTRTKKGLEHLLLPSYRIVGGIVLTVLTGALLGSDRRTAGVSMGGILAPWFEPPKKYPDEQAVIVGHVLAHGSTVGYEGLVYMRLKAINGHPVRNLREASKIVDDATRVGLEAKVQGMEEGRYLRLEFEKGPMAVIDTWTLEKDTEEVLELHMVPSVRSEDLKEGNNGGGERRPVLAKL